MKLPRLNRHDRTPDEPKVPPPYDGYERLDTDDAVAMLKRHDKTQEELADIEGYERAHQARTRVLNMLRYLRFRPAAPRDPEMQARIEANRDRPPEGVLGQIAEMRARNQAADAAGGAGGSGSDQDV